MDDDLIQRLFLAESDFLDALQSGPHMLASYHQTLSPLLDVLSIATKTGNVGTEALSLAHLIASHISGIASCSLDIKRREEFTTAQLFRDFDAMCQQMANLNLNAPPKSLLQNNLSVSPFPSTHSSTLVHSAETWYPPFLAPAYRWLLDNLHNPYPTAEVKTQIAASSSQLTSINSWFANARRRIGWTTLCRERFSNCRADMIDAAYRALVQEDSQSPLSPELRHSFIAIKVAAESLYSSTFSKSALVEDIKAREKESIEVGKCHQVLQRNPTKTARNSHPSPDRSITTSPPPTRGSSPTDERGGEENVTPLILAGSKRRRSSAEPAGRPPATARPVKRLRASIKSQMHFPSLPSSTGGVDASSDNDSLEPALLTEPETNKVLPSPQRRLSEADAAGVSKRPSGSMLVSRLHTVSDLLPRSNTECEYAVDNWFDTDFDTLFTIPPPVDATELDLTTNWEVELFKDYSIPGNLECSTPATADTCVSAPADLSDIGDLLHSIGDSSFTTPLDSILPSDIVEIPYAAPFHLSIPNFSQTNIDWTLPLNGRNVYQPTFHPTFPQYSADPQSLPEIDLSMLQLPQIKPAVSCQRDMVSKQAKLNRLHAMQEEVRRIEQELKSQGVVI